MKTGEKLAASGRSAKRTRYRCRWDYARTYGGVPIEEDDPEVCLNCNLPAQSCKGEYECYMKRKREMEKRAYTPERRKLERWKPTGIYDIHGENL